MSEQLKARITANGPKKILALEAEVFGALFARA